MWTLNSPSNHIVIGKQVPRANKLTPGRNGALEYSIATQALGYILVGTCILVRVYTKVYWKISSGSVIVWITPAKTRCEDASLLGWVSPVFEPTPLA